MPRRWDIQDEEDWIPDQVRNDGVGWIPHDPEGTPVFTSGFKHSGAGLVTTEMGYFHGFGPVAVQR